MESLSHPFGLTSHPGIPQHTSKGFPGCQKAEPQFAKVTFVESIEVGLGIATPSPYLFRLEMDGTL